MAEQNMLLCVIASFKYMFRTAQTEQVWADFYWKGFILQTEFPQISFHFPSLTPIPSNSLTVLYKSI